MAKINVLIQAAKLVESDEDIVLPKTKGSVRVIGLFAEEDAEVYEQYSSSIQSSPSSMSDSESKKGKPYYCPGSREQHNRLEKNRRAEMKQFFIKLKQHVPSLEGKPKASNASILAAAKSYIEELKKLDKRYEVERYRLHRCRVCLEEQVKMLKEDIRRQSLQNELFSQVQQEKKCLKNPKEMTSVETQANEADILAELPVDSFSCTGSSASDTAAIAEPGGLQKQSIETFIISDSSFSKNIEEDIAVEYETHMTKENESFSLDNIILPRYSEPLDHLSTNIQYASSSDSDFSSKSFYFEFQHRSDDEEPDLEIEL
ncbi:max dimerization protein 1 [Hydra vulgaris]|uniref:max dimerization protein 1 n=1 Tax=Hydra vulgaris TaxID=6087 RepID=UPI0006413D5D|nr:max dimerization protein 1 [Hydra vulgaris]